MNWQGEFARRFRMLIHRRKFDADLEEEPTLDDADDAGVECYLETFDRRNPGFYQRLGFSAVGSHAEPVTGATYTLMRRNPKTRSAQS
jgi:hypothetical protein